jgi:alginate O-acetyltransferase complex protein AlgJ
MTMDKHPISKVPLYQKGSREEEAEVCLKRTAVSRAVAATIILIFLATLLAEPVFQHIMELHNKLNIRPAVSLLPSMETIRQVRGLRDCWALVPTVKKIKAFETAMENDSVSSQVILPLAQNVLIRLGAGNEKVYCGRDRWLFYRPEIDFLTTGGFLEPKALLKRERNEGQAIQPDPRKAILQFRDQLAERGIALIVMPVPCKPAIHPEQFSRCCAGLEQPLQNPSSERLKRELTEKGVLVFDCGAALVTRKREQGAPQYLETDTHWRPDAMEFTAGLMNDFIRARVKLPERLPAAYRREEQPVSNLGDLAAMLKLPPAQTYYAGQTVVIHPVMTSDGNDWRADPSADVLVLGDSFFNIYSDGFKQKKADPLNPGKESALGWGASAGFIEQLAYRLQRPLDCIVQNDSGAFATRHTLARELTAGKNRLAGKKLVIWEFAERELAEGDWKLVDLTLGKPAANRFLAPPAGTTWMIRGLVKDVTPVPRPGTVPYKDHVLSLHLVKIVCPESSVTNGQAVVYLQSMRDNVWTPAARLRPGDSVTMRVRPWSDVAPRYERINRTELPDDTLQLVEPCWGELNPTGR